MTARSLLEQRSLLRMHNKSHVGNIQEGGVARILHAADTAPFKYDLTPPQPVKEKNNNQKFEH